jgi:hypothetical protein
MLEHDQALRARLLIGALRMSLRETPKRWLSLAHGKIGLIP